MKKTLRLGTRGSPLALLQAEETRKKLFSAHVGLAETTEIEIVPITTSGDWRPEQREQSFRELGGNKEFFTKEIDDALLTSHIDMAVHSMKDVPTWLPDRMIIGAYLLREDPRDAFIGRDVRRFEDLPSGAVIGTASLRRQAQILALRPDLRVVSLRGNVETRLKKIADGMADATLLAMAGLNRLGLKDRATSVLSTDVMLPAAAQGALGIAVRKDDDDMRKLLASINVRETEICVVAERAFLNRLDGTCHTPIGALAILDPVTQHLKLEGVVAKMDGTSLVRMKTLGLAENAEHIGDALGAEIKAAVPADFFTA
jgi:hydroxymethylbilane synthase